jgi:hypothetical protein
VIERTLFSHAILDVTGDGPGRMSRPPIFWAAGVVAG